MRASLSAFEYGLSLAKENDGREDARNRLTALIPVDAGGWCDPSVLVELGPPAQTILRVASERNADLIVMGAQGHGALGTMLFGSTTQTVVRRAACPVLTARGNV